MVITNWEALMDPDHRINAGACHEPKLLPAWQHAILSWRAGPVGYAPPPNEDDFQVIHDSLSSYAGVRLRGRVTLLATILHIVAVVDPSHDVADGNKK